MREAAHCVLVGGFGSVERGLVRYQDLSNSDGARGGVAAEVDTTGDEVSRSVRTIPRRRGKSIRP